MKMAASPVRALAAVMLLVLAPLCSSLSAQSPRRLEASDSVSRELAMALLHMSAYAVFPGGSRAEPELLVGAMPPDVAARIPLPANARIMATATTGRFITVIASVPATADSAVMQINRELAKAGWTPPPSPFGGRGGFFPAPAANGTKAAESGILCRNREMLTFDGSFPGYTAGTTTIMVQILPGGTGSTCSPGSPGSNGTLSQPTVLNPTGRSVQDYQCSPYSSSRIDVGSVIRTDMLDASILDYYGRQLVDSGWTAAAKGGAVSGRSWSRRDSLGRLIETTITIWTSPLDPQCRELRMQTSSIRDR